MAVGGGGDLGNININISGSGADDIIKDLEDVGKAANEIKGDGLNRLGEGLRGAAVAAKNLVERLYEARQARKELQAGGGVQIVTTPPGGQSKDLTEIAKKLRDINAEAKLLITTFGQKGAAPALVGLRQQAEELHREAGTAFKGFVGDTATATKATSFLGRGLEKINGVLARTGLDVRSVSVLLGAGLAGGIAGVIKILSDLGQKLAAFVARLQDVQRETRLTFGPAVAEQVERFAESAADAFGRTESQMLELANAFAALGKSINIPQKSLDEFSTALASATARLERSLPGFKSLEDVQKAIASAIKGDTAALRSLGITIQEEVNKALELFGKLPDVLTESERAMVSLQLVMDEAGQGFETAGRLSASTFDKLKNLIEELGEALGDVFTRDQLERFNETAQAIRQIGSDVDVVRISTKTLTEDLGTLTDKQLQQLLALAKVRKPLNEAQQVAQDLYIEAIEKEIALREEIIAGIKAQTASIEAQKIAHEANVEAFLASQKLQDQAKDLILGLARAEEDGARRIREAVIAQQRAREDAAKRTRDVLKQNRRQTEDANTKFAAAERNLVKVRDEAKRKVEDLEREHNRKLEDFADKRKDLRRKENQDLTEALNTLFEAQLKGDIFAENAARRGVAKTEIENLQAERDLRKEMAREREDFIRNLGRLEIDTNRDLFEAKKQLEEAERDRQRAAEDAIDRLHDLEVENARALFDANKRLEDARRDAQRAIDDAKKALDRFGLSVGLRIEEMKELLDLVERLKNTIIAIAANPFDFDVPFSPGFVPPGGAHGFTNFPGGLAMVGERGRELVNLPRGSDVIPNDQTERILQSLGKTGHTFNITQPTNPEIVAAVVAARISRGLN